MTEEERRNVSSHLGAELTILTRMSRFLGIGLNSSTWEQDQMNRAGKVRRTVQAAVSDLVRRTRTSFRRLTRSAHAGAVTDADRDLRANRHWVPSSPSRYDHQATADNVARQLSPVYHRVEAEAGQRYQRMITAIENDVRVNQVPRMEAAERALARLADEGITGFVDRRGKHWDMVSYVEMITRTMVATVARDSKIYRLQQAGVEMVFVDRVASSCQLCAPWEGKVLSLGEYALPGAHASLVQAKHAGLFHPSCRHRVWAYLPGVTQIPPAPDPDETPDRTEAMELRYLERMARRWDRRGAVALNPAVRTAAVRKHRDYRSRIAALVQDTGLKRQPHREQHGNTR